MGVKRTQKTASASLQKKAKQVSSKSQEDDGNETKSVTGRCRAPKKNYYESDNSYVDDSDDDPDFEKTIPQKSQSKRKMDSESEDDDEILTKAKKKKPRQVRVKKKIPSAKQKNSKKDSSDSGNSSDESEASRTKGLYSGDPRPLLSSEGSDSDTIIPPSCPKKDNKLKSKPIHKVDNSKEPVTSFKLINKSIDTGSSMLKNKDLNVKIKCESNDGIWEEKNLEDSEEEMKEIKMEVKIDPDDKSKEKKDSKKAKTSIKEKKGSKKSAATKKGKGQSKCKEEEEEEEDSGIKEMQSSKVTKKNSKSKSTKSVVIKKEKKSSKIKDLNDVSAVLMQFEGKKSSNKILSDSEEEAQAQDSSESDWEEVEDDPSVPSTSSGKPQESIEITLEQKQFVKKKKRVGHFDWKAFFRRQMNVFQRDLQIAKHKVHLLCLIGHGMVLNKLCCDPVLKALSFSLVSVTDKQDFTVGKIKTIITAFSTSVRMIPQENDIEAPTYSSLVKAFSSSNAKSTKEYTMMVVMTLRSLGLKVRLVMSFHPFPLKKSKEENEKKQNTKSKKIEKEKPAVKKTDNSKNSKITKNKPKEKTCKMVKKSKKKVSAQEEKCNQIDDDDSSFDKKNRPSRRKSQISYKEPDGSDFDEEDEVPEKKKKKSNKTLASKVSEKMNNSSSSGSSDFEEDSVKFSTAKRTGPKPGHKIISSSSSNSSFTSNQENKTETWIEVYVEKEKRWLSVDCVNMVFDDLPHFESLDSRPLSYILTFDNDGYLKDVTPRYSSQWMLKTRKLRVQEEWWEKTMEPYMKKDENNEKEDAQIQANLLKQPLPKAISEYKNHPLYVLKRHLLKFEAIYPNSALPLGYIRNEPVYARECVHQLHARETWMKEGRNVKVGEEPYKMVKSRPKWNKPKENPDIPDLPVFGFWQTEVYVPPPAVDGKIPRNEYGNVELYKPTMLPAGTVHLREPGLNKIARKLGFDCAAAMVGWDFHGGSSHPVFDGWIVCVENKETILKEWVKDQERAQLREIEKREKRIYGNWKKLIRGLLIRERLKKKYDLTEPGFIDEEQEEADDGQPQNRKKENEKTTKSKEKKKKDDCKS